MYKKLLLKAGLFFLLMGALLWSAPVIGDFYFDGFRSDLNDSIIDKDPLIIIDVAPLTSGEDHRVSFNAFILEIDGSNVLTKNPQYNYDYSENGEKFRFQATVPLSRGQHSFRIVAYDYQGNFSEKTVLATVLADTFKMDGSPIIYPSPATDNVKIYYKLTNSDSVDIVIYNLNGQVVYRDTVNAGDEGARAGHNLYPYNLRSSYGRDLPNGVYVVTVIKRSGDKTKLLGKKKFIILREDE
jgi:hypothetical protein